MKLHHVIGLKEFFKRIYVICWRYTIFADFFKKELANDIVIEDDSRLKI